MISNEITNQLVQLLIYLAVGEALICVYDFFRIMRLVISHKKIWVVVEDILYWTCATFFVFYVMLRVNDGAIRGYSVFAMIAGMVFYNYCVSRVWVRLIGEFMKKGLKKASKIVRIRVDKSQ